MNYAFWKNPMKLFIQGMDYQLCEIIVDGPITVNKDLPIDQHKKILSINAKARNILTNGV